MFCSIIFILSCLIHRKEGQADLIATLYIQEVSVFGSLRLSTASHRNSTSVWTPIDTQSSVHCHTPDQTDPVLYLHHIPVYVVRYLKVLGFACLVKVTIQNVQNFVTTLHYSCGLLEMIRSVLISSPYGERKIVIMLRPI